MCRKILWELHIHTVMSGLISIACAFILKNLGAKEVTQTERVN